MSEWWINNSNQNMLMGIPGDLSNPAKLDDSYIQDFLAKIPEARKSFNRIFPTLTLNEQDRLQPLYDKALASIKTLDQKSYSDQIQSKWNKSGIQTSGPRGGTRMGGNC